jgi:hypothetical protein
MNRNSHVERVYPLGDYKTLRLSDDIIDIPMPLAMDKEFMGLVRYLQLVEVEITYRKYFELLKQTNAITVDEAMKFLAKVQEDTMGEIKAKLEDKGE